MTYPERPYTISADLYYDFAALIWKRACARTYGWIAGLLAVVSTGLALSSGDVWGGVMSFIGGSSALVALFALHLFRLRSNVRKVYRESADLGLVHYFSLRDGGFKVRQESGEWRYEWRNLAKWEECERFVALQPNRVSAILLPKDQIPHSDVELIREQIREAGLPKSGKLRK